VVPAEVAYTCKTPAFRRQRQEDCEFEASFGYIARPCLKNNFKKLKSLLVAAEKDKGPVWV
jgi:hypothetical protein